MIDRGHSLRDRALIVAAIGVAAVFWSQFIWVRATNFHGTDEWVFQWVSARGILGSPYSNRPFNFLWTIPGAHVGARRLRRLPCGPRSVPPGIGPRDAHCVTGCSRSVRASAS